jgi:acyl-CoA synthetase (AMP-forming)/AMP-acid ligase II
MRQIRSLIDLLRERAATSPDRTAFTFLDDGETTGASMTWGELEQRSRAIAVAVANRVAPSSRVLVMCPPSLDFIPAFFGTIYAGAIAVPAYPPAGARADRTITRLNGMIADAGVDLVLTPAAVTSAGVVPLDTLPSLDLDEVPNHLADDWRVRELPPESLAFLQYTSGSTSAPRGVMVSHRNLLHNLSVAAADARYNESSRSVSWLPVNHDMGLINGVLQPVFSGFEAYLMAPAAFLQRPARWLQAISRLGATHSGGPNFAYDLCVRRVTDADCTTLDLSGWHVAYNGSEPIRRSTLESFQRKFGARGFRWEAFSPAYGLAESTLLVANVPAGVAPVVRGDAVASGFVSSEARILIVDPVSRITLPEGATGEIWVAGDSVARGYWNLADETRDTFNAYTTAGDGPFLRTGDLGAIHDGTLFVTGRIKDVLIVRGVKHYPQDIELTVEHAHSALRPGGCAAVALINQQQERIAIVAEIDARERRGGTLDLSQVIIAVRVAVASAHHVSLCSVTLVQSGSLPKTTSGKLQRYLCREGLVNGTLEPLAVWTADTFADQVAS